MDISSAFTQIAQYCGQLLNDLRPKGLIATDKSETLGAHFSTGADDASQELGLRLLKESLPDEVVIAEEQANATIIPANCTVFDPCDGTTNYFNGCNEYGVTLCMLRDGQPVHGVMYFPSSNRLIAASRGEGCFLDGRRIRIKWDKPLDKTMIGTDIGPWAYHGMVRDLAAQHCIRSIMAAIYGAREVLEGHTGAYYNLNIAKIWDAAAGVLAVTEAGGVACAPDGSPLRWDRITMDWVIAANQELADRVVAATKQWKGRQ